MAMTALFLSALPRPDLVLGIAHVDHGLRGREGAEDARWVERLAEEFGLPCAILRLRGKPAPGESTQDWARRKRYAALERIRAREAWDAIATAHHRDDQAETVLYRIARGTGISGLAGIRGMAGRIVRPTLGFTAEELGSVAEECGMTWREDRSNRDMRYDRNRIRHRLLPVLEKEFPGTVEHLSRLAEEAAALAPPELENVAVFQGRTVYYPLEILRDLGKDRALALFREGLRRLRRSPRHIGRPHLESLWGLVGSEPGARVHLPRGWEARRETDRIRIAIRIGGSR